MWTVTDCDLKMHRYDRNNINQFLRDKEDEKYGRYYQPYYNSNFRNCFIRNVEIYGVLFNGGCGMFSFSQ